MFAGNSQPTNLSSKADNALQQTINFDEGPSFHVNVEDSFNHESREVGQSETTEEFHGIVDNRNSKHRHALSNTKPIMRTSSLANHAIPVKGKYQAKARANNASPV